MGPEPDSVTNRTTAVEINDDMQPLTDQSRQLSEPLISDKRYVKRTVPWKDLGWTSACTVLSLCGCLIISPQVDIAWHLRFKWQIVAVGLILSLMGQFCAKNVIQVAFLLYEARFGRKKRKNYRAIMTDEVWSSSTRWKPVLGFLALLPLCLSIGYKQFLDGNATRRWDPDVSSDARKYGIDFPRIGSWSPPNDSIYLLLTSLAPFKTASNDGNAPYPTKFPQAYGYNTLLLSNDSAAILDIPTGPYMAALQAKLSEGDHLVINAWVDAYVATRNTSTSSFVTDDTLWNAAFDRRFGEVGLTTMSLYKAKYESIGILPFGDETSGDNNRIFIALYYNSTHYRGMFSHTAPNATEFEPFRQRAQLYNLDRERCHGTWQLNKTSILLLKGECNETPVDSTVLGLTGLEPFPYDILPPLVHTYEHLINHETDSSWLPATYSVSVATMYWARGLYMFGRGDPFEAYPPIEETVDWVRPTLRADPELYIILVILPVITVAALAFVWSVPKVPEGERLWDEDGLLKEYLTEKIVQRRTPDQ